MSRALLRMRGSAARKLSEPVGMMIASFGCWTLQQSVGEPLASHGDSDGLRHLVLFTFACLAVLVVMLFWRHEGARQARLDARQMRRTARKLRHLQGRPKVRA